MDNFSALFGFEIHSQALFVTVEKRKVPDPEAFEPPRHITGRRFDMDDFSTKVCKNKTGGRTHHGMRECENLDTLQRQFCYRVIHEVNLLSKYF
jgi:hypothetical protein